jgi:hypothetical protein
MPKNTPLNALRVWPHFNPHSVMNESGDYVPQSPHNKRLLPWLLNGLLCLCLLLSLTGCGSTEYVRVKERDTPPVALLQDCAEPLATDVTTNGLLLGYVGQLRSALRKCNDDKAALREWAKP